MTNSLIQTIAKVATLTVMVSLVITMVAAITIQVVSAVSHI